MSNKLKREIVYEVKNITQNEKKKKKRQGVFHGSITFHVNKSLIRFIALNELILFTCHTNSLQRITLQLNFDRATEHTCEHWRNFFLQIFRNQNQAWVQIRIKFLFKRFVYEKKKLPPKQKIIRLYMKKQQKISSSQTNSFFLNQSIL